MNKGVLKIISSLILCSFLVYTTPVLAYTKEETVYSKTNSKGENYKTIVSAHLKNEDGEEILKDISDLINIENTNGDETFTQNGEELTWAANGADIYYQGETEKDLPIKCSIKYELNGQEISAEDLAGKSGKVKITIRYENTDEHIVSVNGKTVAMYTPFTVICGTMFDNTENKNIEVSSGKVVNDGTKTMIMGVAMPGMQESLNISKNKIDIPSSIEITMDTQKYEQNNIITFVTPRIFKEKVSFRELNNLYSKIDEIQQASKQIEEGANTLKDGVSTLSIGANELNNKYTLFDNGINSAYEGSKKLTDGTKQINAGVSNLQEGTTKLNGGVSQINQELNKTDLSGLRELTSGIETLYAGSQQLKEGSSNLQLGVNQYVSGTESLAGGVKSLDNKIFEMISNYTTLLNQEMAKGTEANPELIIQYKATIGTLQALQAEEGYKQLQSGATSLITKDKTGLTVGQKLNMGANGVKEGSEVINAGALQLNDAVETINGLGTSMTALKTNLARIQKGTEDLNSGVVELKAGTTQTNEGSKQLTEGLEVISDNSKSVKTALNRLSDGSNQLKEGSIQLADGITQFNTEAIDKIVSYVNSDVRDIAARAEKLQELSQEYANFTKAQNETAKEVKFLLIADSIKVKDEKEEN